MSNGSRSRSFVGLATLVLVALATSQTHAAPRTMTGSLLVENPSAGFEMSPGVYGRKEGGAGPNVFPPTDGAKTISVLGTTATTAVGRQVTLPASQLSRTGFEVRDFPAFDEIAQVSKSFMTVQGAATFAEDHGALAVCPGPGCTGSGTGTAISWCPPLSPNTASPAPGTAGSQVGNWDCPSWQAGQSGGDRHLRISISNASGRNHFGGTLSLLRNHAMNVWRVPTPPSTPNASDAEVTRSWMNTSNVPWSGGRLNFDFTSLGGNNGPRVLARLDANGGVDQTFGCANGTGTVGGNYVRGSGPITNAGNNCGTATVAAAPGQGWGFKMTTGTISGSDPAPLGLTNMTAGASVFNPNFGTQPSSQGFFFSRAGDDSITTGSNRNIVMLGGGVAVDPGSGNAFFRITRLHMNLAVPEPATGLALAAGLGGLALFARRRRNR
ncbi:MAG: PEP-CTERM sorting domain-containing protein [Myxococcota bacterium]